MMQKANLLILDEPTNHLDIDSKEVLEVALSNFPGSIIFVSHDRYFINKIAHQVVDMQSDGVTLYLGDYNYFVEKKAEEKERAALRGKQIEVEQSQSRKEQFEQAKKLERERRRYQREIDKLEKDISLLEKELADIENQMTLPEIFNDHEKSLEYMNMTNQLRQDIDKLMDQWTNLQEKMS